MIRFSWTYGLFPEAMAMGVSNILVPMFIVSNLNGNLFDVGMYAAVSGFSLIPSLVIWGRLVDKYAKCSIFMLISFLGMAATFLLMSQAQDVYRLLLLSLLRSMFYAASVPSRQIMIVESNSREFWESELSRLQFVTGLGGVAGIALASIVASTTNFPTIFVMCSIFCLFSAATSVVLVRDPGLMIERRLLGLERFTNTLVKASTSISMLDTNPYRASRITLREVFKPSMKLFIFGIFTFSFAGSALFVSLPVYFLRWNYASTVFLLFLANSLASTFGYFFASRVSKGAGWPMTFASAARMMLIPLLILVGASSGSLALLMISVILAFLGFVWAMFDVSSTSMFMQLSRVGKAGTYSALTGLGSASGGLIGGYVAMSRGFEDLFIFCSMIYTATLVAFVLQSRKWSRT